MRKEKGITIMSLIVYVIAMVLILVLISRITTYFYKNIDITALDKSPSSQYTKFATAISKETNIDGNSVIMSYNGEENIDQTNYIVFSSGNQYTFKKENNSIYKNKVKICENIDKCSFSYEFVDSKYVITIAFKSGNLDKSTEEKELTYTINM